MFSILIPSYNNLNYLKLCIESIYKNSKYHHQIIVHVQEGTDGTINYLNENNIDYTKSSINIGASAAFNKASSLVKNKFIVISHDDFYYCPNWDVVFENSIKNQKDNYFMLTGTMVGPENTGHVKFDCGKDYLTFDENKLLKNLKNIQMYDFQGATKHPALIHKSLWSKVNGWSEEFTPAGGDDTDFLVKLWFSGVRIFKGLGKCSVYHFGSVTTRKKNKNLFTYLGSKANKIFVRKWSMSINFFENNYLKSGFKNKKLVLNKYDGPLLEPKKNIIFILNLIKFKIYKLYLDLLNIK